MPRSIARLLVIVVLTTTVGFAQTRRVLTTADYDRAVGMLAPALNGLVVGGTANANWMPDGRFWYVRTTLTGTENVVIDPVRRTREIVATPPTPVAAAAPGGRGGGGGRGGVQITRKCGPNVTGRTGTPPASTSPDGRKASYIC